MFTVYLPVWCFRLIRCVLPWMVRQRGGWRLRKWLLDIDRSRMLAKKIKVPLETGAMIWIDPNDSMARYIFVDGIWEPTIARHFRATCRAGDVVLDIGANIGQYAVLAAGKVGNGGRVIAVEVNPRCLPLLENNLELCRPVSADILPIAAWSENRELSLSFPTDTTMGLARVAMVVDRGEGDSVSGRRLDEALAEHDCRHVDVMKIDIEGAELPALQGLSGLLDHAPPRAIYCEIEQEHCCSFGYTPKDIFEFLAAYGYQAYAFSRQSGDLIALSEQDALDEYSNMFHFVRDDL